MCDGSATQPTGRNCRLLFALAIALGMAGLAACAPQQSTVSPEQRLAMIPTGEPLLTCRADCLAAWQAAESQAQTLAVSHRWVDLGLLVLRINYEDDLTDFYLAEAAQGMGYRTAAASYYRQSIELSGTPNSCARYSRLCGGVFLPQAARTRLAALVRMVPRRPPPIVEKKAEEPPAAPVTPVVGAPLAAPVPTVRAPSPEEEQFIEPPPARP